MQKNLIFAAMKLLSLILAFYIFALNLYPCTDSDLAQMPHETVFEKIPHKHQSSEEEETCSPFCICDCCQVVASHFDFNISIIVLPAVETVEMQTICTKKPRRISFAVWRPPTQTV